LVDETAVTGRGDSGAGSSFSRGCLELADRGSRSSPVLVLAAGPVCGGPAPRPRHRFRGGSAGGCSGRRDRFVRRIGTHGRPDADDPDLRRVRGDAAAPRRHLGFTRQHGRRRSRGGDRFHERRRNLRRAVRLPRRPGRLRSSGLRRPPRSAAAARPGTASGARALARAGARARTCPGSAARGASARGGSAACRRAARGRTAARGRAAACGRAAAPAGHRPAAGLGPAVAGGSRSTARGAGAGDSACAGRPASHAAVSARRRAVPGGSGACAARADGSTGRRPTW
jgi:hypothetical protein